MNLIGKEMFAVDGCKMPSNASKEWSGTKEELRHKKEKMEQAVRQIVERHREVDAKEKDKGIVEQEGRYVETIRKKANKIKDWLQGKRRQARKDGQACKEQHYRQRKREDEDLTWGDTGL